MCDTYRQSESEDSEYELQTPHKRKKAPWKKSCNKSGQPQPFSKLAAKKAQCAALHGESQVKADGERKGQVRCSSHNGTLEWWSEAKEKWVRAAYHDSFREEFILLDEQQYQPYETPPARGNDPLDITSNCDFLDQNLWNFQRANGFRQIMDSDGNMVMRLDAPPTRSECVDNIGPWYHKGYLMLDIDNFPVANIADIPRCFSSRMEGGRMEALLRVFPWLQRADIRARMPMRVDGRPLFNPSTFGQRQNRYRDSHKMVAWNVRKGTEEKKAARDISSSDTSLRGLKRKHRETNFQPSGFVDDNDDEDPSAEDVSQLESKKFRPAQNLPQHGKHQSISESAPKSIFNSFLEGHTISDDHFLAMGEGSSTMYKPIQDHRGLRPQTLQQQMAIKQALSYTIADYRSVNNREPPPTNGTSSYMSQVTDLEIHHQEHWIGEGKAPELVTVDPFYSFDHLPIPILPDEVMARLLAAQEVIPPSHAYSATPPLSSGDTSSDFSMSANAMLGCGSLRETEPIINSMTDEQWHEIFIDPRLTEYV